MATVTGLNLLEGVLESLNVTTLSPLVKDALTARLQHAIEAGTDSNLQIAAILAAIPAIRTAVPEDQPAGSFIASAVGEVRTEIEADVPATFTLEGTVVTAPADVEQIRATFASAEVGNGNENNTDGELAVAFQQEDAQGELTGDVLRGSDEGVTYTAANGQTFDVRDVSGAQRGNMFTTVKLGTNAGEAIEAAATATYINAGAGSDVIVGGAGADFLVGGEGDDQISAGAGDSVIGGAGVDTVVVSGTRASYLVNDGANAITLSALSGGTVNLVKVAGVNSVENIRFSDGTVSVADLIAPPAQTFTLTASADEFTPTSQQTNSQTTEGNDVFNAGSVQGGGAHTLGAADTIDGGAGSDTMNIIEDRAPAAASTLFPNMQNVENANIQALTAATVDFTNTTGIEVLTNKQSVAGITVNNLVDDATFNIVNTATNLSVDYFNNNNADTTADVMFDQANGASLTFDRTGSDAGAVADAIDTLNVTVDNQTVYNIGAATFDGLNQANNLTTINLSGDAGTTNFANLTSAVTDNEAQGLTEDLTTFNAAALEGALNVDLLGNNNDITFNGAVGNTTLAIGQGNNTVTMQGGDDLVVLSSTGFDVNDVMDGGDGFDTLEIHANDANSLQNNGVTNVGGLDDATDALVQAINSTTNFERLILDVWTQTVEAVDLDVSLITSGINTYAFDDTDSDIAAAPGSNNINDLDVTGAINVTNATGAQSFEFLADQTANASFSSAAAGETLNVELMGHDSAQEIADDDSLAVAASGFTTVNATLTNVDVNGDAQGTPLNATTTEALGTSTLFATIDNGATLNVDGTTGRATVNAVLGTAATANDTLTLNASALNTLAGTDIDPTTAGVNTVANNVFTVQATLASSTITTTEQADTITASNGNDTITAGAGDDIINAGTGNDTVFGGAGNDIITAGRGVDYLDGGEGDDTFIFTFGTTPATEGITSADTVIGGEGNDTVQIDVAATLNDQIYNNWSSVENLDLANGANTVSVNSIANAAGLQQIIGGTGIDNINVGEGFSNALTIDLSDDGVDVVDATNATGALTIFAQDGDYNGDTIIGGTGTDTVQIEAANGIASLAGVTAVENVNITSDATTNVGGVAQVENTTVVVGPNTIAANGSLNITAANMVGFTNVANVTTNPSATIDASLVATNGTVNVTGSVGDDTVYGTTNADTINGGAGDDVIFGGNGADTLTGGEGNDQFTYAAVANSSSTNTDVITDFVSNAVGVTNGDQIVINTALLGGNTLKFAGNQADFGSAQGATTQDDAFIDYVFQTDTNTLWVDINNDGTLNADDLQIKLDGVSSIVDTDVTNGLVNTSTTGYSITGTAAFVAGLTPAYAAGATSITVTDDATVAQAVTIDGFGNGSTTLAGVRDTLANLNTAITNSTAATVNSALALAAAGSVDITEVSGDISGLEAGANVDANIDNYELASGANAQMSDEQHAKLVAAAGTNTVTIGDTTTVTAIDNVTALAAVENYVIGQDSGVSFAISGITGAQRVDASNAQADDGTTVGITGTFTGTVTGANSNDTVTLAAGTNISGATIGAHFVTANLAGDATMTNAQHIGFTTLNAAGTNNVTITTAANLTADADVETYTLNAGGTVITSSNTDVDVTSGQTTTIDTNGQVYTGTAALSANNDTIILDNGVDYSAGNFVTIETAEITSNAIVTMQVADFEGFTSFTAAGSETVTFSDAGTVNAHAAVEAYSASAGNALTVNVGEAATAAYVITGNDQADTVNLNAGWDVTSDTIDGGTGTDTVNITYDLGGAANLATGITNVEQINVTAAQAGALTIDDAITAGNLTVNASSLTTGLSITNTVDGTKGDLSISFGSGNDTLDAIDGTGNNDIIINFGAGNDTLSNIAAVGTGTITLNFGTSAAGNIDSNVIAATTADLATGDVISFDGLNIGALATSLTASGTAGAANTLVVETINAGADTLISLDVNGNGILDAGQDVKITITGQALTTADFNIVAGDAVFV